MSDEEQIQDVNFTESSTTGKSYVSLNADLGNYGTNPDGSKYIKYASDREAARQYFLNHVNPNMQSFLTLEEKLRYLVQEGYYEEGFLNKYKHEDIKSLAQEVYAQKFRFETFMGAFKFYSSYALKTRDGKRYLERIEDRFLIVALYLSGGDIVQARKLALELISGRFVTATPTLLNSGRKARGELVSCFLLNVSDDLNGIMRAVNSAAQLSKRGGGVALNLTNLRASGDPIKKVLNQASGVIPVMKILEDTFSYANQLGARQGAGAVYLNAHHLDVKVFLDSKRENADEKIRIKTLSLGLVIPDITFELARNGEKMYLFSPYDLEQAYGKEMSWLNISEIYREAVENPNIRKTAIDPREFLSEIAEVQMESGYPYIMFEDAANRDNQVSNVGPVKMSNLCVAGDTLVLTDKGYRKAEDLYNSQEDFNVVVDDRARLMDATLNTVSVQSSTKMFKTAENAEVFRLTTVEGHEIRATEWHKFYIQRGSEILKVQMNELNPGDKLLMQPALDALGDTNKPDLGTVASIVFDGVEDVYDVTVENGNSLIFNGFATGNCVEILQPQTPSVINDDQSYAELGRDISCNLGSLNVAKAWDSPDFANMIETAVRALTEVTDRTNIEAVPTVANGNRKSHSIGLGSMNLHGWFTKNQMYYGDEESMDATNVFYQMMLFYALTASNKIAQERQETFDGFVGSSYQDGSFFKKFTSEETSHLHQPRTEKVKGMIAEAGHKVPTAEDWAELAQKVAESGLYHSHFLAMAPTGSISYVNWSTPSVLPITSMVERRQEGKTGLRFVPAPYAEGNEQYYNGHNMYDIENTHVIDVMSIIQYYVDQSISLTLGYESTQTTRDVNKSILYAFGKGKGEPKGPRAELLKNFPQAEIKTLYYSRVRNEMLGENEDECVACAL